jgi:preprotein translocase subunit SecG
MHVFIIGLHVVLCFFLILVVLLQPGKGADFGAAMGGSSAEMFGASGSVTLLTKLTAIVAGLFMMTSLALAWFSTAGQGASDLGLEDILEEAASDSTGATGDEGVQIDTPEVEATPEPVEGDTDPIEGDTDPIEGDTDPIEGDAGPVEGDAEPAPEGGAEPAPEADVEPAPEGDAEPAPEGEPAAEPAPEADAQ